MFSFSHTVIITEISFYFPSIKNIQFTLNILTLKNHFISLKNKKIIITDFFMFQKENTKKERCFSRQFLTWLVMRGARSKARSQLHVWVDYDNKYSIHSIERCLGDAVRFLLYCDSNIGCLLNFRNGTYIHKAQSLNACISGARCPIWMILSAFESRFILMTRIIGIVAACCTDSKDFRL